MRPTILIAEDYDDNRELLRLLLAGANYNVREARNGQECVKLACENPPDLIKELASKMNQYGVKPEIEVFDLAMLYNAINYVRDGVLKAPLHVQFVLGVKHALPAERDILEFQVAKLQQLMPEATWVAAGIGRFQLDVNRWCLEMGGHCRTGLEDNVRWDKHRLAASNAELVARVAGLCAEHGRPVATPAQARSILGLN